MLPQKACQENKKLRLCSAEVYLFAVLGPLPSVLSSWRPSRLGERTGLGLWPKATPGPPGFAGPPLKNSFKFFGFCITYGRRQPSSYRRWIGGRTARAFGCGRRPGRDLWAAKARHLVLRLFDTTSSVNYTNRIGFLCFPSYHPCPSWFRAKQSQLGEPAGLRRGLSCETKPISAGQDAPSLHYSTIPAFQCGAVRTNKPNLAKPVWHPASRLCETKPIPPERKRRVSALWENG